MTIVLLKIEEKTQMCEWKEQGPYCHVDHDHPSVDANFKWLAIEYFIKEQKSQGRPVKSKTIDFTV